MSENQPDWLRKEQERAEDLNINETTSNPHAPKLVRVTREPSRKQKAFYIQDSYALAFEDLVHEQKKMKGQKAPVLAEEALMLLFEKHGVDTSKL